MPHSFSKEKSDRYYYLYKKRYPVDGPSISSSCGGKNDNSPFRCGCWTHQLIELEKWDGEKKDAK